MVRGKLSEDRVNNAEALDNGKRQKHIIINEILLYPRQKQKYLDDIESIREIHMSHEWEDKRLKMIREVKVFIYEERKLGFIDNFIKKYIKKDVKEESEIS